MVYLGTTKLGSSQLGSTAIKAERGKYFAEKYSPLAAYSIARRLHPNQQYVFRGRIDGIGPAETLEKNFGFDAQGNLDEAAVAEFGGYNLLSYSEEFENAYWTKFNSTLIANQAVSPDGLNSAYLWKTGLSSSVSTISQFFSLDGNQYNTISCHVKSVGSYSNAFGVNFYEVDGGSYLWKGGGFFDLVNKSFATSTANNSANSATMTELSDGWFLCSVTTLLNSGQGNEIQVRYVNNINGQTNTGETSLYLWGAQLTKGFDLLPYQPRINGASDVFVTTLYDASGNGHDLSQGTALNQPKIYDLATKSVVKENGKPAMDWGEIVNNRSLQKTDNFFLVGDVFAVAKSSNAGSFSDSYQGIFGAANLSGSDNQGIGLIASVVPTDKWYSTDKIWDNLRHNSLDIVNLFPAFPIIENQTLINTNQANNKTLNGFSLGADRSYSNRGWQGTIQAMLIFDSDQSANRTQIEDNINTYYGIY